MLVTLKANRGEALEAVRAAEEPTVRKLPTWPNVVVTVVFLAASAVGLGLLGLLLFTLVWG